MILILNCCFYSGNIIVRRSCLSSLLAGSAFCASWPRGSEHRFGPERARLDLGLRKSKRGSATSEQHSQRRAREEPRRNVCVSSFLHCSAATLFCLCFTCRSPQGFGTRLNPAAWLRSSRTIPPRRPTPQTRGCPPRSRLKTASPTAKRAWKAARRAT